MKRIVWVLVFLASIATTTISGRAQTFTTLLNFDGGINSMPCGIPGNPQGPVVLVSNVLYGTTYGGQGAVYKYDHTGVSMVYHFTDGIDANGPFSDLILSGNTFYGLASGVLASYGPGYPIVAFGTVYSVDTSGGSFTHLHDFSGGNDGGFCDGQNDDMPLDAVILSGNTLYGTTEWGGTNSLGVVYKLNATNGGFTVLHSFGGGNPDPSGGNPEGGVVMYSNALYGTTASGGTNGMGSVFKINPDGT